MGRVSIFYKRMGAEWDSITCPVLKAKSVNELILLVTIILLTIEFSWYSILDLIYNLFCKIVCHISSFLFICL